jgi:oxygen-independent coproporphyrinogen III oxidase
MQYHILFFTLSPMAGIYIHIPYCRQACSYCNFHFSTNLKNKKDLLRSLLKEIELQKNFFSSNEILNTIYIGGGTPSLLEISELEDIISEVNKRYNIGKQAEITIEVNPDDINIDYASSILRIGFNRISLGVQSFVEKDLQYMNRIHNSKDSLKSIEILQQAGFENISCDLIYGSPTLTDEDWIKNLDILIEKNIPHLSCYALTVEPKTILKKKIKEKKLLNPMKKPCADIF